MFLFLFINHIFHIHIFPISRESDWGVFILIQSNLNIKSTEWNWILCSLWTVICMYPLRQVWLYLYLILNIVMMINVKYSFLITGSWEESFKKQFTSFCPVPTLNCISTLINHHCQIWFHLLNSYSGKIQKVKTIFNSNWEQSSECYWQNIFKCKNILLYNLGRFYSINIVYLN